MKLGFVSAILDQSNYEEMMDIASDLGFECVEVACWPQGKAERRYAGVSHIDAERVLEDEAYAKHILDYAAEKNVEISSLAYYPNTLDPDLEKRQAAVDHLMALIKASAKLGINMVTSFIGRDQSKTVEENLEIVKRDGLQSSNWQRSRGEKWQSRTARCSLVQISGQADRT